MAGTGKFQLSGSGRTAIPGGRRMGATDKDSIIEVTLRLRRKQALPDVMTLGAQMPQDRTYMTQEDFKEQYGADAADAAKVESFAHEHNLTVKEIHLSSRVVKLQGTVGALSKVFGVKLNDVRVGKAMFRQRTGMISIPEELKGIVIGVHGMDNRPVAKPHFRQRARRKGAAAPRNAADGSLSVTQIAQLYNFPAGLTGKGQCIAIIELNDLDNDGRPSGAGFFAKDISGFFKQIKTPKPSVVSVGIDGGANIPGQSDSDGEVVLDIEVAGGVAPGAKIAVYFAPNTTNGFINAVKAAAHDAVRRPSVISISWGGPEDPRGQINQQFLDGLNEAVHDAALMGITVCIAAGDDGSADMAADIWDRKPHADFPASSPFALACGGTELQASKTAITSEVVWNEGRRGGAGGGGISNVFDKPPYQATVTVPKSPAGKVGRGVPDVAGNADPATGYQIFQNGARMAIGGTSAVAPLMAGLVALINERLTKKFGKTAGFINPLIYPAASSTFRDIVDGDNDIEGSLKGTYKAGTGWDACTGLGVPDGSKLLALLGG